MVVGFFFGVKKSLITILSEYYVILYIPRTTLRILLLASPDSQVFPSYPVAIVRGLSLFAKKEAGKEGKFLLHAPPLGGRCSLFGLFLHCLDWYIQHFGNLHW